MSNHSKLFRCEPTVVGAGDSIRRVQLLQGGLEEGKPTIEFQVQWEGGTLEFRCWVAELRQSLDILEPLPAKRVRKSKAKAAIKAEAALDRTVSREDEHRG